MASMAKMYGTAVRDEIKLFTAWPIGTNISLGDVGFLTRHGKLFERRTNLANFDTTFGVKKGTTTTDFDITLARDFETRFKAAGNAPLAGSSLLTTDVGVAIGYGEGSSVVVRAHTVESSIDDLQKLEADLIRVSTDAGSRWHSNFVVVTTVYESTGTTIILSSGKKTNLDIKARADVAIPFDLADVNVGLAAASGSSKFISALARTNFVPFFQAHHIAGRYWGPLRLELYG
ncbi:MAG TPA: hypothetical protein VMZ30_12380 [Pyrinomonadaceae bacterium]|nr:hypothetical protein [Pyrinomonadaceae bacterium]